MSVKSNTRYILKHKQSGFYVTSPGSYTEDITKAKLWEPNNKRDELAWQELSCSNDFEIVMRIETTTVEYEEAPF